MTKSLIIRFEDKIKKGRGCWLWKAGKFNKGYGCFRVKGSMKRAHRVAWEIAKGPIPAGLLVLHRCDVPACVRVEHLFLGTALENATDCSFKGRNSKGERNGRSKLTAIEVAEIRRIYGQPPGMGRHRKPISQKALSELFGVSHRQINRIVGNHLWRES